jgi:hypothetical protein
VYRQAPSFAEGDVRYGPFPLDLWKLGLAPLLWFLAYVAGGMADVRLQIDCDPSSCVVDSASWRRPKRAAERVQIREVELQGGYKDRSGREHARAVLLLTDGRRLSLDRIPVAEAQEQVQQLKELREGKRQRFRHDSGDLRWLFLAALALYLAGVLLVADALQRWRPFALRVSRGEVQVREFGRWGPRLPARSLPVAEVSDVAVRWHQVRAPAPKTPAIWGATLDLVYRGGRSAPLTTLPRSGLMAHYDAAVALKSMLGLSPWPPLDLCPPEAMETQSLNKLSMLLPMIWMGLCCGSLAGMALYGLVRISLDPQALDQNVDGGAMIGAGLGAVGLASLLGGIVVKRYRERRRYERFIASPGG